MESQAKDGEKNKKEETEMEEFEATMTQVGNSEGIIVPSYIRNYRGFHKGDKFRVVLEKIEDGSQNPPSFNEEPTGYKSGEMHPIVYASVSQPTFPRF